MVGAGRRHAPREHQPVLDVLDRRGPRGRAAAPPPGSPTRFGTCASAAVLAGEPTRFLASFDPVATPAQLVERERGLKPGDVLAQFRDTLDAMDDAVCTIGDRWSTLAEAPPG